MSSEAFCAAGTNKATRLFELASAQHGVVTTSQMAGLGFSKDQLDGMKRRGSIRAVARGVYTIGHARDDLAGRHAAALLMAGRGAYLFRRSAAALLGLPVAPPPVPELGIPATRTVRHRSLVTFRSATIDPVLDVRLVDGMPTTNAARTLVDLAGVLTRRELTRACERAVFRKAFSEDEVIDCLRRARNAKGAATLRAIISQGKLEGSGFEREVIDALGAAGAAPPLLQEEFHLPDGTPFFVDLCWHERRLVVEVDGPHHLEPVFAKRDSERDAALKAQRYGVIRVSDARWKADPGAEVRRVLSAL